VPERSCWHDRSGVMTARRGVRGEPAGVLLTPGAGSDRDQATLVAIEQLCAHLVEPIEVERLDFPYRKAGKKIPDRAPVLLASIETAAREFAERLGVDTGQVVFGGRSMGGRMCSMAVADGLAAKALVLICYPLHPPGKPDRLRTEHLPRINVPCLFLSGTKDQFGTPDELTAATSLIPGPVTHVWVDGADHSLRRRDDLIAQTVVDWVVGLPR
jgi:uncharacterized protein